MTLHTRSEDDDNLIKINREVPLWSIITGMVVIMAQAGALYYGQARLNDVIIGQASSIKDLGSQINVLSTEVSKANLKTVEYDFRIGDIDRRLRQVETNQMNMSGSLKMGPK